MERIFKPELVHFLKKNPNPRIVLRVPTRTTSITTTEADKIIDYTPLYGRIERNLIRAGFTVRDRGLLNALMKEGLSNYREIGQRVEADIIIELESFEVRDARNKTITYKTGRQGTEASLWDIFERRLIAEEFIIECKIIIVEKGQTGGMLTYYFVACEKGREPCNFVATLNLTGDDGTVRHADRKSEFPYIKWYIPKEDVVDLFSAQLITVLQAGKSIP